MVWSISDHSTEVFAQNVSLDLGVWNGGSTTGRVDEHAAVA